MTISTIYFDIEEVLQNFVIYFSQNCFKVKIIYVWKSVLLVFFSLPILIVNFVQEAELSSTCKDYISTMQKTVKHCLIKK